MRRQVVDTEIIKSASNRLRIANKNLDGDFQMLMKSMRKLEYDWKGAAATAAHSRSHELLNLNEARSTVKRNYINLLEQQVSTNYVSAESTNTSLANKFK